MGSITEIEAAIKKLPQKQFAALRRWFAEIDAENWDRQFEKDVKAERLDKLANEALKALEEGRCTDL